MNWAELATFVAVARQRSFRKAAVERGVAASAVSHAIRSLEGRVGVRLFHRTTRSVSLTDAGERFLAELQPACGQISRAPEGLNAFRGTPFGTLRPNVPASLGPFILRDVMGPLMRQNPGLHLDVVATDKFVDIVEQGFGAGVRLGESLKQNMIAVRIKPRVHFVVVGSPAYLNGRVMPATPADLRDHASVRFRFPSSCITPADAMFQRDYAH